MGLNAPNLGSAEIPASCRLAVRGALRQEGGETSARGSSSREEGSSRAPGTGERSMSPHLLCLPGVQIRRWVVGCLKRESEEHGSPPPARSQSDDALLPPDPERDPSAAGVETERELEEESLALDPGAGSCPGPSEDPEKSIKLRVPAICVPGAHGPKGLAEQHRSLSSLEQEYEQTYFLKDTSSNATSQTYYIFGQEVTPSKWNMFMTLIGLEGNEIERCRYENRGNLIEVHHEMLITWRSKLGREASIFKLMAALHQMRLRTCLENIINKLIAENILAKHAETPN
ncbi:uncharacterized protein LOC124234416 [Equus quagga]|uniref:uncharacterized protein LOC124234416 n=1 Tax=Equus quagga TaxID=89248 RepID=UPI001EE161D6|nr:uncharacterized protein LOC124234416 [Equus quagga]